MPTTAAEATTYVEMAMTAYPTLTHFGFGLFGDPYPEALDEKFLKEREDLKSAIKEIATAADWISGLTKIQSYNRNRSSYSYKHLVETWASQDRERCYVANGSFIAAAVGLGYEPRRIESSPNAYFQFSESSIKKTFRK